MNGIIVFISATLGLFTFVMGIATIVFLVFFKLCPSAGVTVRIDKEEFEGLRRGVRMAFLLRVMSKSERNYNVITGKKLHNLKTDNMLSCSIGSSALLHSFFDAKDKREWIVNAINSKCNSSVNVKYYDKKYKSLVAEDTRKRRHLRKDTERTIDKYGLMPVITLFLFLNSLGEKLDDKNEAEHRVRFCEILFGEDFCHKHAAFIRQMLAVDRNTQIEIVSMPVKNSAKKKRSIEGKSKKSSLPVKNHSLEDIAKNLESRYRVADVIDRFGRNIGKKIVDSVTGFEFYKNAIDTGARYVGIQYGDSSVYTCKLHSDSIQNGNYLDENLFTNVVDILKNNTCTLSLYADPDSKRKNDKIVHDYKISKRVLNALPKLCDFGKDIVNPVKKWY